MIRRAVLIATSGLLSALLPATAIAQQSVATAPYAELRGLDRLSGELTPYEVRVGGTVQHGDLLITVSECRYPTDNPSGDAFAYLVIKDERVAEPVFEGWMIASSPALNALDHMRYDVWLIRCRTSSGEATGDTTSN